MSQKLKYILLPIVIIAFIIIAIITYNFIKTDINKSKYLNVSFKSESEMIETINGSWTLNNIFININEDICTEWSDGNNHIEQKHIILDYENGKIIFDNGYYYDVIMYNECTYIRITPNASSEKSYYLFEKCNKEIPE